MTASCVLPSAPNPVLRTSLIREYFVKGSKEEYIMPADRCPKRCSDRGVCVFKPHGITCVCRKVLGWVGIEWFNNADIKSALDRKGFQGRRMSRGGSRGGLLVRPQLLGPGPLQERILPLRQRLVGLRVREVKGLRAG